MSQSFTVPKSFVPLRGAGISLLLKARYQELLLRMGIEDFESFLKKHARISPNLTGRTAHFLASLSDGKHLVIRRYSHGGLLRFMTRDVFLRGSRSFEELRLTEEVRSAGIPTVEPVAAVRLRAFLLLYKAYLLSIEIPGARDSVRFLVEIGARPSRETLLKKREAIRATGLLLRRFHQSGFFHRDLQLRNILIAGNRPFLIDFDRSYRDRVLSREKRINNLLRLNRSVEKRRVIGLPLTRTDRWRFFLAYSASDPIEREAVRKALHRAGTTLFIHRLLWKLQHPVD